MKDEEKYDEKNRNIIDDLDKDYYEIDELWETVESRLNDKLEDENVDLVSSLFITYLYEPIENEKIASLEPYINANKLNLSNIYEPTINISKKIGK